MIKINNFYNYRLVKDIRILKPIHIFKSRPQINDYQSAVQDNISTFISISFF